MKSKKKTFSFTIIVVFIIFGNKFLSNMMTLLDERKTFVKLNHLEKGEFVYAQKFYDALFLILDPHIDTIYFYFSQVNAWI